MAKPEDGGFVNQPFYVQTRGRRNRDSVFSRALPTPFQREALATPFQRLLERAAANAIPEEGRPTAFQRRPPLPHQRMGFQQLRGGPGAKVAPSKAMPEVAPISAIPEVAPAILVPGETPVIAIPELAHRPPPLPSLVPHLHGLGSGL
jgi:hypothetical protein